METSRQHLPPRAGAGLVAAAWHDTRHAVRRLRREPGFALAAILILALGIGASTAMFAVVHAVLLGRLPYGDPERLVLAWEHNVPTANQRYGVAPANYTDFREQSTSFDGLEGFSPYRTVALTGQGEPERIRAAMVTGGFFDVIRVAPALGRALGAADTDEANPNVVVLMDGLWRRKFGGDTSVIGRQVSIGDQPHTVVGVMPRGFVVPTHPKAELVLPLRLEPAQRQWRAVHFLTLVGRLEDGVSVENARVELAGIASRLEREHPDTNAGTGATVLGLRDALVGDVRPALLVLLGAVLLVLLVACANISNLLLARASVRRRELSVRAALGASRGRLALQLVSESTVLSLIGGALGAFLASWLVDLARTLGAEHVPQLASASLDATELLFAAALAIGAGVLAGTLPALEGATAALTGSLRDAGRSSTPSQRQRGTRRALAVAQVSTSLVLLVGAGLLLMSFVRLQRVDPGFQPDGVLTLTVAARGDALTVDAFYDRLFGEIEALPGVVSAGAINQLPMVTPGPTSWLTIEGHSWDTATPPEVGLRPVTERYFETMGIPLVAGRAFAIADRGDRALPALVNETFVRRFCADRDPIGLRVRLGPRDSAPWHTIIGVVGDAKTLDLATAPPPDVYLIHAQQGEGLMMVAVRTTGDPIALAAPVRRTVASLDPLATVSDLSTMDALVARSTARPRFSLLLLGAFAAMGLLVATVGTYSVLACGVAERTVELGVRIALGARPADVLRLVLGEGLRLVALGTLIGGAAALALAPLLRSMLFEAGAADVAMASTVPVLLAAVTLVACAVPAWRAMRLQPVEALRAG